MSPLRFEFPRSDSDAWKLKKHVLMRRALVEWWLLACVPRRRMRRCMRKWHRMCRRKLIKKGHAHWKQRVCRQTLAFLLSQRGSRFAETRLMSRGWAVALKRHARIKQQALEYWREARHARQCARHGLAKACSRWKHVSDARRVTRAVLRAWRKLVLVRKDVEDNAAVALDLVFRCKRALHRVRGHARMRKLSRRAAEMRRAVLHDTLGQVWRAMVVALHVEAVRFQALEEAATRHVARRRHKLMLECLDEWSWVARTSAKLWQYHEDALADKARDCLARWSAIAFKRRHRKFQLRQVRAVLRSYRISTAWSSWRRTAAVAMRLVLVWVLRLLLIVWCPATLPFFTPCNNNHE